MHGAIPPLPQYDFICGAQLIKKKHGDNFTLYFLAEPGNHTILLGVTRKHAVLLGVARKQPALSALLHNAFEETVCLFYDTVPPTGFM
jgi:hypothetical protein